MVHPIIQRLLAAAFCFLAVGSSADADEGDKLLFRVSAPNVTISKNGDAVIEIHQTPVSGWHSYWVNPGDVGLATEISWKLPPDISAGEIIWPTPQRIPYQGGMTFGYADDVLLRVKLHNASDLKPGTRLPVSAHVSSLVCQQVCEPIEADIALSLTIAPPEAAQADARWSDVPEPLSAPARVSRTSEQTFVDISLAEINSALRAEFDNLDNGFLFLETNGLVPASAGQTLRATEDGIRVVIDQPVRDWPQGQTHAVLALGSGASFQLTLSPPTAAVMAVDQPPVIGLSGVLAAAALAFAGGLILNLMPCVFPILSIKLLALSRAGHAPQSAEKEAIFYALGVLVSFLGLSLTLDLLRHVGAAAGWGFHLQSPYITGALTFLLLLVGLNLSGLIEFGNGLQSLGATALPFAQKRGPVIQSFLTGVLAVIVAAPCTAPFMATAIGVALAHGALVSSAIFAALGCGFAAPMVVLTAAINRCPAVARLVPRPGRWMVRVRLALAVPMYASALWMAWVFAQQTGLPGVAWTETAVAKIAGINSPDDNVSAQVFSQSALDELRKQNRPVFVDITAAWCVTCKINESLVINSRAIQAQLRDTETSYLVADWTNKDDSIRKYMSLFERIGVPLYVYYGPHQQEPVILPQILTVQTVLNALRRAELSPRSG